MLDYRFVRENLEAVKENVERRNVTADPDLVVELYDRRNAIGHELEQLRAERNENAKAMKGKLGPEVRAELIEKGKAIKTRIPELEATLAETEAQLRHAAEALPNMTHPDAPLGAEESANTEVRRWGTPRPHEPWMLDHVEIGRRLDLIDFDTATNVAGPKFYYLKNEAVLLELALARLALDEVRGRGFTIMTTPDLAREEILQGIGFNPRGDESNVYTVEGEDLCLIGTAEITLGGYHAKSILEPEQLPIRLAGLSHCFRREAGAAGRFSKGLYRVHQFTKVEMFVYTEPERSEAQLEELVEIEETIFRKLEVPYRLVDTCTGDLGGPAYRKFDIEAWMPGRGDTGDWGEVTSASNCTDYQARRLGVRTRADGKTRFVHMLNGTAIAVSRGIVALLENGYQEDGSVRLPAAVAAYTGFDRIAPRTTEGESAAGGA
jgi:seryl-tRNA synthetase